MIWFHNRVVENAYPNAGTLAEQFEISNRQAQRDIEYMRDSMNAPLLYCARKRGYRYEKAYVLPSFFLSESEKETVRLLAKQSKELSSFGYGKYEGQAEILSKISAEPGNGEDESCMTREPYFAEIEMLGGRASAAPLEYFLCGKPILFFSFILLVAHTPKYAENVNTNYIPWHIIPQLSAKCTTIFTFFHSFFANCKKHGK